MRFLKFMLVLAILIAAAVGFYVYLPYGPSSETFVEIAPGTGTPAIARQLQQAGIIRNAEAFMALKEWKAVAKSGGTLKAGEYRFDHAAPLTEVYDRMRRGDVFTVTLVIPEGFNIFDIAKAVQDAGLGSSAEFLKAERHDADLVQQWAPHASSLEGYLFPDTYKFARHATPLQMLATMVKRFDTEAARLGLKGDVERTVTMASLVEREVHIDAERPEVASVFENRLAAGMPLQTDPAVVYASLLAGTWTGVIHERELHSESSYNTYVHPGLPPGPICNPGLAALKAVMHPASTQYLYFVADANGATRFAATLSEHNSNVETYRRNAHP
ncbi:MAG: endolytic transglycosylase MltG [Acidobacteriota bacterium]